MKFYFTIVVTVFNFPIYRSHVLAAVWPVKSRPMSIKVAQKWFLYKNERFWHLYKICIKIWAIWAKQFLPQAFKSCPKCNKSPNLATLCSSNNAWWNTSTRWCAGLCLFLSKHSYLGMVKIQFLFCRNNSSILCISIYLSY